MKIKCAKADLAKGVNIVSKAVPTRTTMSILQCILIDASAGEIKMTANDMELGIETIVEGEIEERGMIALDAKIFSEMVRKLPDNEVVIETNDALQTAITCEKAKFNIAGRSGEEFSGLPYVEKNEAVRVSQFTLKEVVRQTIFSRADNEANKIMTGELFEIRDDRLRVVALDGHRVAVRNITLQEHYSDHSVVVPGKTLQEISKIIGGEAEDMVELYFTENHILFEFDQTRVVSRLLEGNFFPIDQVLSTDYDTRVEVSKRELMDCIDRATLLVREGDKKPIIVRVLDGVMELMIYSTVGSMNEEIAIQKEGKDILIGFNPKYFIDALRAIDEESVTLYMMNPKAPCFIRDDENRYVYMILPVNFTMPN